MTHLDPELLAGLAFDDALADEHRRHLDQCPDCAATLAELQALVERGRSLTEADEPVEVGGSVWASIRRELEPMDEPDVRAGRAATETAPPVIGATGRVRRRTRGWATILVAAAIGILVGALGVIGIRSVIVPGQQVQAEAPLTALPGKVGSGQAELLRGDGGEQLRLALSGLPATPDADLEVWLINTDGKRMASLGSLSDAAGGTLPVPGWLIPAGYRIVDVSVEPRDGNPAHSGDSEVRGTLPG